MQEKSVLSPIGNPSIENKFEMIGSKSSKAIFAAGEE
jgi:hypothetical protein